MPLAQTRAMAQRRMEGNGWVERRAYRKRRSKNEHVTQGAPGEKGRGYGEGDGEGWRRGGHLLKLQPQECKASAALLHRQHPGALGIHLRERIPGGEPLGGQDGADA